jgi:acetoin utilization protein AcuC
MSAVCVYIGEELARYGFGQGHPFGPDRMGAFWLAAQSAGLASRLTLCPPVMADRDSIERFHTAAYVDRVIGQSATGTGYLDLGDTPAFPGVYEAAAYVVGSVLDAIDQVMAGGCRRAFVPIAGLHHARRDSAAGFCVFNDCGVAIETLRSVAFEDDPELVFADLHEDGRYLYPGTGAAEETGTGAGQGLKLNLPMPMQAGDEAFYAAWNKAEAFVDAHAPEFILLQCGADSIAGDPITHLQYTAAAHAHAARRLCVLADRHCRGRLLAMGGGGYNRDNLALAWTAVVSELADAGE